MQKLERKQPFNCSKSSRQKTCSVWCGSSLSIVSCQFNWFLSIFIHQRKANFWFRISNYNAQQKQTLYSFMKEVDAIQLTGDILDWHLTRITYNTIWIAASMPTVNKQVTNLKYFQSQCCKLLVFCSTQKLPFVPKLRCCSVKDWWLAKAWLMLHTGMYVLAAVTAEPVTHWHTLLHTLGHFQVSGGKH